RVRTIFQETPDQIGKQVPMSTDGRIDAAAGFRKLLQQRAVKNLAHAVQALELKSINTAGVFDDCGNSQRVMRRELRKKSWARGQKFPGTGEIAKIGHRLAREDRII